MQQELPVDFLMPREPNSRCHSHEIRIAYVSRSKVFESRCLNVATRAPCTQILASTEHVSKTAKPEQRRASQQSTQRPQPKQSASAGNRTPVTSMATMYSTTRPLMLLPPRMSRVPHEFSDTPDNAEQPTAHGISQQHPLLRKQEGAP